MGVIISYYIILYPNIQPSRINHFGCILEFGQILTPPQQSFPPTNNQLGHAREAKFRTICKQGQFEDPQDESFPSDVDDHFRL